MRSGDLRGHNPFSEYPYFPNIRLPVPHSKTWRFMRQSKVTPTQASALMVDFLDIGGQVEGPILVLSI
ncbi:hypothetical protein TNCV_3454231 [Trichonephila clavipes]|nr:hypothetical protein TNCV_3454231 [Trichonephila clavipes]